MDTKSYHESINKTEIVDTNSPMKRSHYKSAAKDKSLKDYKSVTIDY